MTSPLLHPPMTLQAQVGQALTIELTALPGAGLQWQLPAAPAGCSLTEAQPQAAGAGVGGSMRQRFVLTCTTPGERVLRFEYKRPWEPDVRAVQGVTVQVR